MEFWLVIVLLLCVATLAVLLTMLPTIASKLQVAVGAFLGGIGAAILALLWSVRKGGKLDAKQEETKQVQAEFEQVVEEVLYDIRKEEKPKPSILDERL